MTGYAGGDAPRISAIVCTYNRGDLLSRALGALCGQTLPRDAFEVVVVDDGSTDDTGSIVESFSTLLPLRYAYQANAGLASGKNHGLFLCRGEIAIFLDDDDVAAPDCLEQHLQAHAAHPAPNVAVLGYTGLSSEVKRSPLMEFVTGAGGHLFSYARLDLPEGHTGDFSLFWGGRSSCKREYLLRHGVFNPIFTFGAEDIELGYRLSKHGFRVVYHPRARSTMIRSLTYDQFCNRCYRQGLSNTRFAQLHPVATVKRWAELDGIEGEWRELAPIHDQVIETGRALDCYANNLAHAQLPMAPLARRLLHRAYFAAFRASRIKGSIDRAAQDA